MKKTEIMYVPLLETLQNQLNNETVLEEVSDVLKIKILLFILLPSSSQI